jgi:hypothetical protein
MAGLERLWVLFTWPWPTDTLEGTLLYEARLVQAGEVLYQPLVLDRFVSAPYPPLHYMFLAVADRLPGPHIFWGGRLVSVLATLLIALLIVLTIRRASGSWLAGLIGMTIFISAPPVTIWAARIKPDILAIAWTALGLYLATSIVARESQPAAAWRWVAMISAFVCAFFTKQTAVAAPLAVGIALLSIDVRAWWSARKTPPPTMRWPISRATFVYGITYLATALGVWFVLDQVTGGQYSVHVWWGGERTKWWSFSLFAKVVGLLESYLPLLILGIGLMPIAWRDRRALVPACYALIAPLTTLGAGETGSHHNHLLDTLLAYSIAALICLAWLAQHILRPTATNSSNPGRSSQRIAPLIMLLTLLATGLLAWQMVSAIEPHEWYGSELVPNPDDTPERFLIFIQNTPGEILADDPGLLLMANKPIRYNDASTQGPAATTGKWDQSGLIDDITNRRFSAIVIPVDVRSEVEDHAGRWTPEMITAINTHYRVLYRDRIMTYIPR